MRKTPSSYAYRNYRPGDEVQILELFQEVFRRPMSAAYWRWMYRENPAGEAIIEVAESQGRILGHYAVVPRLVCLPDEEGLAVLSTDTMVHRSLQGLGVFQDMANRTYEKAAKRGVRFVYGFPNQTSLSGFVKRLQWSHFEDVPMLTRTGGVPSIPKAKGFRVEEVSEFGPEVDELWAKMRPPGCYSVVRDRHYLNWRYVRRPEAIQKIWMARDERGSPAGYLVCKVFERETRQGDLMDFLASTPELFRQMVCSAIEFLAGQGIAQVNCWLRESHPHYSVLKEIGFQPFGTVSHFGGRYFGFPVPAAFLDPAHWRLSMGDSDLF